jgi:hypothetical protein
MLPRIDENGPSSPSYAYTNRGARSPALKDSPRSNGVGGSSSYRSTAPMSPRLALMSRLSTGRLQYGSTNSGMMMQSSRRPTDSRRSDAGTSYSNASVAESVISRASARKGRF